MAFANTETRKGIGEGCWGISFEGSHEYYWGRRMVLYYSGWVAGQSGWWLGEIENMGFGQSLAIMV